jgi:hypothetical protein
VGPSITAPYEVERPETRLMRIPLDLRRDDLGPERRPADRIQVATLENRRDTGAAIERARFRIERSDRLMFAASRLETSIPHILGVARRP